MTRLQRALRILPGEGPVAARTLALMLTLWTGIGIGGNAVESLFFARFGPRFLPFMYLALGPLTFLAMAGTAGLVSRIPRSVVTLPLVLAGVVAAGRALLVVHDDWVYPVLWLLMMVVWTVQGIAAWGLAGAVNDTRQAKRLFPLYGAGLIAGGVIGGFLTRPLAALVGVENLLVLWAVLLVGGFVLARAIAARSGARVRVRSRRRDAGGAVRAMVEGARSVRASRLLRWMAVAFGLFGLLYFAIALPFARAATARYPDAEELAGFLGLFFGVANGAALVVSLLVANRLFARFGVATMVVVLGVVYALGFTSLAVTASFAGIVAFRFLQLVWVYGVWAAGWQALFGVVPPDRRDGVRVFMEGGPWQAGVVLSGVALLVADWLLGPSSVFVVGAVAGVAAAYAAWRARREYTGALVDALHQGWPDVFIHEEEPFGGMRRDAAGVEALMAGLTDPDPTPRRMAVEIVATISDVPERLRDATVRLLEDSDPEVRTAAAGTVARWGEAARAPRATLRRLLQDPEPAVRAGAAASLAATDGHEGTEALRTMAASPDHGERAMAVVALGHAGVGFDVVSAAAGDEEPTVRIAAVTTLSRFPADGSVPRLAAALGDPDTAVRGASAASLARLGAPGAKALLHALSDPLLEDAALRALTDLEDVDRPEVLAYAGREATRAARYHELWQAIAGEPDWRLLLLADSVRHRALGEARRALMAVVAVSNDEMLRMAVDYVESHHPEQRANALETVDAVGDPQIVRPLLPIWEPIAGGGDFRAAVQSLLGDDDAWVRACAALAAPAEGPELRPRLEELARSDPDELVRETAERSLRGETVETLPTLPLMERIMFLRSVPLFADMAPEDLKHIAAAVTEHLYQDGTVIAEQGELGEELFLVTTGEIRVVLQRHGSPMEVARRSSGEFAGEMGILSGEPRMASLVASGEVRALSLDRTRFERILVERPAVAMAVMQELTRRIREAYAEEPVETKI